MNKPYNRETDPKITKDNPYLHHEESAYEKRRGLKNSKNNSKGVRLIITNIGKGIFIKYRIVRQTFRLPNFKGKKHINHYLN